MLKNYLTIALRNLRKHAGYTAINVVGLAIGLACCLLIALYVKHELSYDRFNTKADRIYRVGLDAQLGDEVFKAAVTTAPMARTLVNDFPEVEQAARFFVFGDAIAVRSGDQRFLEERFFYADSTVFDVFSFPLLEGDPKTALAEPNTLVLTQTTARKYFGDADPVGETLVVDGDDYRVTGVMADVPDASHLHFDLLGSMAGVTQAQADAWVSNNFHTYILLAEGADAEAFEAKLPGVVTRYVEPVVKELFGKSFAELGDRGHYAYTLTSLTDIHLRSHLDFEIEPNGNAAYVYALVAIAALILLIACVNFMNLATARAAGRAREVGVRKSLGSDRGQLVTQFLFEALLMSGLALALALGLVQALLPAFSDLAGTTLDNVYFRDVRFGLGLLGLVILVGLLAGSYPAFFLSSFQPVAVLKGQLPRGAGGSGLRSGLVVFQFAVSIALIVCTGVVYQQLRYVQGRSLGFDKEHVVVLERPWALRDQRDVYRQELLRQPGIVSVATADELPGQGIGDSVFQPEDRPVEESESFRLMDIGYDLAETLDLHLLEGRTFDRNVASDSMAILINEAAQRRLGWADPVGRHIMSVAGDASPDLYTVVGVVEDFHFESLHKPVEPMLIRFSPSWAYLAVRVRPGAIPATLAAMEDTWIRMAPQEPFEYSFLDADFDALYKADQRAGVIFTAAALLAILVACLGLFGLASFLIQQRTKEVGVRKVLGASVPSLVALLSKDFAGLVVIANLIAWPVAYFAMRAWLADFAYSAGIAWWLFALAGGLALGIALLTVSYQAIRAAIADPVKSLRYE